MGAGFKDAFCGVCVTKKCTQVREVMRLIFLLVFHKMSMLIACAIHSLHSIALCDQIGQGHHTNVIVFDFLRRTLILVTVSFVRVWVCVCAWVFSGCRAVQSQLLLSLFYLLRDEETARSQVRSGQGISISKSSCSDFYCQHAKPHRLQWSSLFRSGLRCSFV